MLFRSLRRRSAFSLFSLEVRTTEFVRSEFQREIEAAASVGAIDVSVYRLDPEQCVQLAAEHFADVGYRLDQVPQKPVTTFVDFEQGGGEERRVPASSSFALRRDAHRDLRFTDAAAVGRAVEALRAADRSLVTTVEVAVAQVVDYVTAERANGNPQWQSLPNHTWERHFGAEAQRA